MKTSQFFVAFILSTVLLSLWSWGYWRIIYPGIADPVINLAQIDLADFLVDLKIGSYELLHSGRTDILGKLDIRVNPDQSIRPIIAQLALITGISFLICLLTILGGLHTRRGVQRFIVVFGFGIVYWLQSALILSLQNAIVWQALFLSGIYNLVFWAILASVIAYFIGIKKRNIFRS